jgi:hypothetical protein
VQAVGRATLPRIRFQRVHAARKGGCGQDWPPRIAASRKLNWRFHSGILVDIQTTQVPGGNAMKQFIAKFESQIQGVLSGLDRVVFRGSLRRLTHPQGMKMYLIRNGLLCKEYFDHVKKVSQDLKEASAGTLSPVTLADSIH